MKLIFFFILFISNLTYANEFKTSSSIFLGKSVPFLMFEGPNQFDNYLAMNIPFPPVASLFQQLNARMQNSLKSRGEAHITVITPVEYWNILRPRGVTIKEINQIAQSFNIQSSRFNIICLGQGRAKIENKIESTFFIVVNSEDLIKLRKAIQALFLRKGGALADFNPNNYYPHITLGFTNRDLYESDGVIKDNRSCIGRIRLL